LSIGRTGAIASPIAVGFLVAAGWNMYNLFLVLGVPVILLAAYLILRATKYSLAAKAP